MKKFVALGLAVIMLMALFTACDSGAGKSGPVKDTLTVVSSGKGNNFDPLTNYESDWFVLEQIFDKLFRIDTNGKIVSHVAESWTESEDGMTLSIKLREDIKFHDGTKLNAEAVAYSFEVSHAEPLNAWLADLVPGWEVTGEYTINVFKGHSYTPIYESLLARPHIVSPTAYAADPAAFAKKPVGSGAYKFLSFGSDDVVTLEANADYFLGAPGFKNLVIRPAMESATSVIALQNGEVDLVVDLTSNQVPVANAIENIKVVEQTGWAQTMMIMAGEPFTGNRALRQAIAHAVDPKKAAVLDERPNATIATDLFTTRMLGPYSGQVPILDYNTDKVEALLKEADYVAGTVIPIRVTQNFAALAQSVQADLEAVGITAKIEQVDEPTYNNFFTDGNFGLSFWQYGNDQSSTEDLLTYFTSTNFYGAYMEASPEYDAFVAQFGDFPTAEARMEVMKGALAQQVDFANMVPLYESVFNFAYRSDLLDNVNPWFAPTYHYYLGEIQPKK